MLQDWDFEGQLVRTLKISALIVAFLCLVLVITPKNPLLAGFSVGIATGIWNAFFLGKRLRNVSLLSMPAANTRMKGGVILRIAIILAVLFWASRTDWVNIYGVVGGIFAVPCIFTLFAVRAMRRDTGGVSS